MRKLHNWKTVLAATTLVFAISATFAGCGTNKNGTGDNNEGTALTGNISVVGSTSVGPLAEELQDAFNEKYPDVTIDIQQVGSTPGIKAANDGTAQIGMSSRELKAEEKEWKLDEHTIALDGIAIIVNPSNPAADLTTEQIQKIFKGEIKNWKDIGGPDKEIIVVSREDGSGTKGAFEELMKLEKKEGDNTISLVRQDKLVADSSGAVKTNVASKDNAIGYVSLGAVDNTVKDLKVDGTEATVDNIKSKTYKVSRPFLMLTKGEMKPEVKAFMDFILGDEGQKIVANHYISIK